MNKSIVFIDSEVTVTDKKIIDLAAIHGDGRLFHSVSVCDFNKFIKDAAFICGHNIIKHDLKYLKPYINFTYRAIDTLYLSPLLFPCRPYHHLLKDDKIICEQLNNPLADVQKAQLLFNDEINAFNRLSVDEKCIYFLLLSGQEEFKNFFVFLGFETSDDDLLKLIKRRYRGKICENADIMLLARQYPVELAYALALIGVSDYHSVVPYWLDRNYPQINNLIKILSYTPCSTGCSYCAKELNIHYHLRNFFGYDEFRTYSGEPLQQRAVQAAVDGKSLLAVFPTGGGKSLTFQLPALMSGKILRGLTVVISPLQSLMKDQVDNLSEKGIVDAVTVNGLMNQIERAEALERVASGLASIIYISPEQLRSKTIENLFLKRNVVRFVIDEAHCFSAWGQDFRVDYMYIGDFIKQYQQKKNLDHPIPVSCFTATAKPKVISDICDYFNRKLDISLELYTTSITRKNLHYFVLYKSDDEEKYNALRQFISERNCPTIVYVSRTRTAEKLAEKLNADGFKAKAFYGNMDSSEKIKNQNAFINNEIQVMVATSAFGMGIDKKDIGLIIHYDISDSLENYIQESGRAARDPHLSAQCYVLYNENDLDKHFILLNQTKLSFSEIQQVWKAIKDLTKNRSTIYCSALELVRKAGWDDNSFDIETRVKTAVAVLENSGYVERGKNVPHIYATGILVKNMAEAAKRIDESELLNDADKMIAKRIIKYLISARSIAKSDDDAESRIDYLADILGLEKAKVVSCIYLLRQDNILADSLDMAAFIYKDDNPNKTKQILNKFAHLEEFILKHNWEIHNGLNLKEINELAIATGVKGSSVKNIRTILYYLTVKGYITKENMNSEVKIALNFTMPQQQVLDKFYQRWEICRFIIEELYKKAITGSTEQICVEFSVVSLLKKYQNQQQISFDSLNVTLQDIEDALLYLARTEAIKLEGGFLVIYNAMEIRRLIKNNTIRYKLDDYKELAEYYKQKIQQIHIVGEYANMMVKDYNAALQFAQDYFTVDYKHFMQKYFRGERMEEVSRNITSQKYRQLFGKLSNVQSQIINDDNSKYIVVAAGPGSGKTMVLVHKLAALILLEDIKYEQLLMLTFSRAAATEFKKRLFALIGSAAKYIDIKTFHSYCFDLLEKTGNLNDAENVIKEAVRMINADEVERNKIVKSVLVIDEAQDMDGDNYALIKSLIAKNDSMRIIAVGDDDQNIYSFRGSESKYMQMLINDLDATCYEMVDNYRSKENIISLANALIANVNNKLKHQKINAVQKQAGNVEIIYHETEEIASATVEQVKKLSFTGSSCILTDTNEEALKIYSLLAKNKIKVKLIQSLDGFNVYNLMEVKHFIKIIDNNLSSPIIDEQLWNSAIEKIKIIYKESTCLENVLNMLSAFAQINSTNKYRSDLQQFIRESKYEDFCLTDNKNIIYVSTIHKAKGKEFDNVWLSLAGMKLNNDDDYRKLYVAITRAKNNLYIHHHSHIFDNYWLNNVSHIFDEKSYSPAQEIILSLTLRDVVLDYFLNKNDAVIKLRSGVQLKVSANYLLTENNISIVKLSETMVTKVDNLRRKGYLPYKAEIRFIVCWKKEGSEQETGVVLPDIYFKKI